MQAMSKTAVLAKLPIKPDAKDTFRTRSAPCSRPSSPRRVPRSTSQPGSNDDENTAYIYELYADGDALAVHSGFDMKALMGALGGVWPARQSSSCSRGCRQGP